MSNTLNVVGGILFEPGHENHLRQTDFFIENGIIKSFSKVNGIETVDVNGAFVSAGWIDSHVHCFPGESMISIHPDKIGVIKGVTTVIDAGTSGANTVDIFQKEIIDKSHTKVKILLNVSSDGLITLNELANKDAISYEKITSVLKRNKNIVGLKARISSSVLGDMGIEQLILAKEVSEKCQLPLVVHIGNAPPEISDVLDVLGKDDVITHMYHSKVNGLFEKDGTPKGATKRAIERGVKFDVGHGMASFSFHVAKRAIENGVKPDTISTDIYEKNIVTPVGSLGITMNKLIAAGLSLEEVIQCVTSHVSDLYDLEDRGRIQTGLRGDLTIFNVSEEATIGIDSDGSKINLEKNVKPTMTCIGGKLYSIENGVV
ncbi:amidohydrolase/deacetylase family metallohydrolase [Vallitalea maricola]|uniref:Amidohydrolase/deacetylase family metallohydrolase n=1 Tax=Vallitalea maricola TaxID=3074433 RepID=A0ACB5UFQ6_9FIRM|nr:amidohydrolase/deacetylase family metallohydrolase [Vallitalea sp. AN17-2]